MASNNHSNSNSGVASELERLRDILYGDHARTTENRLDDLEVRLSDFRRDFLKELGDQGSQQGNQLESTRQSVEDKLQAMTADFQRELDALRQEMQQQIAQIRHEMTHRHVLGQLLTDLGKQLSAEPAAEAETDAP